MLSNLPRESVLVFDKRVAKIIGTNEAIVLYQLEYWMNINKENNRNLHNEMYWAYNTYDKWAEDIKILSASSIKRAFYSLEEQKLVFSSNFNKKKYDKTKWYTLNYSELEKVLADLLKEDEKATGQNDQRESEATGQSDQRIDEMTGQNEKATGQIGRATGQNDQMDEVNLTRPIPEITPETTTEITKEIKEEEEEEKEKLKKEKVFSSSELKFKSSFSEIEIQQAKKFVILNLMLDVKKELNWSDDFYNRFICYMTMANTKFISTKQIRTKNIEIEKNHGKDGRGNPITDRAFYIVKGITMKQQSSDADRQAYLLEKAEKEQAEKFRKEMLQLEGVENVILAENGDAHIIFTDEMAERRKKAHEQYFRDLENGNIQYNLSDYATETLNEQDIY